MNLQLLYAVPLYFGNDIIPKFIHFSFALLTAGLIFRYLQRRLNSTCGLLGALFFLSIPLIVKLSITVYVDLGLIFFSTASLLLLFKWAERGFQVKALVLAAVLCGLSMGTKYNGLVTFLLLTLLVPFMYVRYGKDKRPGFIRPIAYCTLFVLVALAVFSPWMARNYHWKKNPVYPLYDAWFNPPVHAQTMESNNENQQKSSGIFTYRSIIYGEKWWEIALLPLRIFFQGKDGDPRRFDGKLNPFLLFFPVLAFYGARRADPLIRREKAILLVFSALFFFMALFSAGLRMRYISPIIPPLVILSVFGINNLVESIEGWQSARHRQIGLTLTTLAVGASLLMNAGYIIDQFRYVAPLSYLEGEFTRDQYIAKYRPEYPAIQFINDNLPQDSLVYFLFLGNRGYYSDREYVLGEGFLPKAIRESSRPEEIWARLKQRGMTHLLLCHPIFEKWIRQNYPDDRLKLLNEFFTTYTKALFIENGFVVLGLKENSG
ncbi:MAG: glycosyltransferase family 39 protein [Deltaproteobacteria bacterium]|nr:glycosyltransferase family 39 protein [Deltaproteobacteria bacterium]